MLTALIPVMILNRTKISASMSIDCEVSIFIFKLNVGLIWVKLVTFKIDMMVDSTTVKVASIAANWRGMIWVVFYHCVISLRIVSTISTILGLVHFILKMVEFCIENIYYFAR